MCPAPGRAGSGCTVCYRPLGWYFVVLSDRALERQCITDRTGIFCSPRHTFLEQVQPWGLATVHPATDQLLDPRVSGTPTRKLDAVRRKEERKTSRRQGDEEREVETAEVNWKGVFPCTHRPIVAGFTSRPLTVVRRSRNECLIEFGCLGVRLQRGGELHDMTRSWSMPPTSTTIWSSVEDLRAWEASLASSRIVPGTRSSPM